MTKKYSNGKKENQCELNNVKFDKYIKHTTFFLCE